MKRNLTSSMLMVVAALVFGGIAAWPDIAAAAVGAVPWQTGFQDAATPVMERITEFHWLLLVIIAAISAFIMVLLLYIIVRFNAKANPVPSKTTHNTLLEVLWTAIPIMILIVIAVPSFRLLYFSDRTENADMTLKAIGNQWYWSYEYPDNGAFGFDALMKADDELGPGEPRLLATDETVVVPSDTNVRLLVTATDVLHSWAIPAFGVKLDAVPGRANETWFRVPAGREGIYYGQCSELCGSRHAFMPIMVKVVSKADFAAWVIEAKKTYAVVDPAARRFAEASGGTDAR